MTLSKHSVKVSYYFLPCLFLTYVWTMFPSLMEGLLSIVTYYVPSTVLSTFTYIILFNFYNNLEVKVI